jgi:outer membrane protein
LLLVTKPQKLKVKTAYVDTSVLMKERKILKQNIKHSLKKRKTIDAEIKRFKQDAANFQSQAQANGQAWAQQKENAKEQQLSYAQQALSQQLQQESGTEMDTLVRKNSSKHTVKKGYSYIYGG